jgi:arylsulfatase A-like enzyme
MSFLGSSAVEAQGMMARMQEERAVVSCQNCNVIMISLTNVRADHLSIYGYPRKTSAHIDHFSRKATVFENAYSVASWTLPVAMSVFTSTYPFHHKVMDRYSSGETFSMDHLDPSILTLVDIFGRQGYQTASFNSGQDYLSQKGLTGRFQTVDSFTQDDHTAWSDYGSLADVVPRAMEWLRDHHKNKFFLHLQGYDAHCPFAYPVANDMFDQGYRGNVDFRSCYWTFQRQREIYLQRNGVSKRYYQVISSELGEGRVKNHLLLNEEDLAHMVALYDGEIFLSDQYLAPLFETIERLGLTNNTIIVIFSEHGDMFGKHGRFMRGGPLRGTFYEDVLHVPLIIYHPHFSAQRIAQKVSLLDLAPTILDFLQFPLQQEFQGKSLLRLWFDPSVPERPLFAGTLFTPPMDNAFFSQKTLITAVWDGPWKLIREMIYLNEEIPEVRYELYNLAEDPQELHNLAIEEFVRLERLNEKLNDWLMLEFPNMATVMKKSNFSREQIKFCCTDRESGLNGKIHDK